MHPPRTDMFHDLGISSAAFLGEPLMFHDGGFLQLHFREVFMFHGKKLLQDYLGVICLRCMRLALMQPPFQGNFLCRRWRSCQPRSLDQHTRAITSALSANVFHLKHVSQWTKVSPSRAWDRCNGDRGNDLKPRVLYSADHMSISVSLRH